MTLLSDLPWLRLQATEGGTLPVWDGDDLQPLDIAPHAESLAATARRISASHAVLVPPDIAPLPVAPGLSPDPALLAAGRALIWPALNDVTGEVAATTGLWVIPAALLEREADAVLQATRSGAGLSPLVVPHLAAVWFCGVTAEAAFHAGFATASGADPAAGALSASFGADHQQGAWWGIGACRALLGGSRATAWDEERALAGSDLPASRRWQELARRVRVTRGVAVHPFDAAAAAALRQMRGAVVPPAIWDRSGNDLASLGPQTDRLRAAYSLARATLWGQPGTAPQGHAAA